VSDTIGLIELFPGCDAISANILLHKNCKHNRCYW